MELLKITKPAAGSVVLHGQLVVQAQPPRVGGSPVTELEFKWVDAPPNQPYVNAFTVDTAKLVQGLAIDPKVTRIQMGRWQVRARVSGRAVPGPWSEPMPFQLVLTQPTQSMQSPQAKSSILQSPKEGIQQGTGLIRLQTTPSQGLGAGTSVIRPRGVEGGEGQESPA
ncbi:MAG: hypothetical protein E8D45_00060, partial [Nitrospira sp.]